MKAFEVMGKIDENRQLLLDEPLEIKSASRVKVILLVSDDNELDPDDTPVEEIKASLRRALQEAKEGKRIPLEQIWEGIDAE
ncbi:hypothetical protein [Limnoraphis robusta]|uniref:Addiction module component n=1 Tax=Limnoraphis robusta CCNP1315 TaxID=3110306 RepID=A0ABU5U204_9CYAN|nr:hypothetical protein [Limnoraphis robusta]MEA5521228.1 hypothetical protein [Limnoraphis robusta CCNP1315]MEA5548972.1 hypothetical protein [Limnoraphis robusta CCNP1324]